MRVRRALGAAIAAATMATGLAVVPATPAAAAEEIQELATVTRHVDGDTVAVRVQGAAADVKVRLLGVQAPEIATSSSTVGMDQCGARAAKQLLDSLLPIGTEVALRSVSSTSTNHDRLLRAVYTRGTDGYRDSVDGEWGYDVSRVLMASGLTLWFPHYTETTHNREYELLAEQAQAARQGLWDPSYCGPGPDADVSVYVNWDAPGDDNRNVNGEWFLIRNHADTPLRLAGWMLRDSALEWFWFPSDAVIPAKSWIRVRVGEGDPYGTNWYFGSTHTMFANPIPGGRYVGDAAYLFDFVGNLRAAYLYGCPGSCVDGAAGKVAVTAVQPNGTPTQEYVRLTNVSSDTVWLEQYYLRHRSVTYTMRVGTYLRPGESLVVRVGKGVSSRTNQYMQRSTASLSSPGKVELLSLRNVLISCKAYGGATC